MQPNYFPECLPGLQSYSWDEDERKFDDPVKLLRGGPTPLCSANGRTSCPCCERRLEEKRFKVAQWSYQQDLSFRIEGIEYHLGGTSS